jgi:crotonobetainyl-CoA:carnitine CoA-transferase CaiB-like acyl-CoA transferase
MRQGISAGEAMRQLLQAAGIEGTTTSVSIAGEEPVFPTTFRLATAGAAAIAATGLAASELWALRTGRRQHVSVSLRDAAAALLSDRYLRIDGKAPPSAWASISGFYETRDGRWIQLHCNFPHHRDGVLRVLGCEDNKGSVAKAVSTWDGEELEDRLAAEGMTIGLVRSAAEWAAHPQARAVASLPVFEVAKIDESAPEPLREGARPLSGVRVLDLTRVIAGPVGGRTLAEHGADVIRVTGPHLPGFPEGLDIDMGHGKRSASIDLRDEADGKKLYSLIESGDVFLQAYRPGSLASRGFSPEELASRRPGIIYATLSAFGHVGPWCERRGFDSLVQSITGIVDEESDGGQPHHLPAQALDYVSGYLLAFGIMTALRRRATEGGSYLVRVSLAQTGRWIQDLGRVAYEDIDLPNLGDTEADVAGLMVETESAFGRLRHLGPVVGLSETAARWERASVPLGSDAAMWE